MQVPQHALEAGAWDDGEAGVAFALDGLVDGSDAGSGSNMERGAREEIEDFGLHGWLFVECAVGYQMVFMLG